MSKRWASLMAACLLAGLAGCASLNTLTSEVSAYGEWPAQRRPGNYVFERLPSQQARLDQQQRLEAAARPALEAAGFKQVTDPKAAEFAVQLSARVSANERSHVDSYWAWQSVPQPYYPAAPGRPYRYSNPGVWVQPLDLPSYEREVVVLIRDAKQGQTLFEAHAVNDGGSPNVQGLLDALFAAALKGFPDSGRAPPQRVTIPLAPR